MSKGYSIRVDIGGKNYGIISDERPEYLTAVAELVDKSITALLNSNSSLSYEKAAVLAALKFCDDSLKLKNGDDISGFIPGEEFFEDDKLRRQVIEYSNEISLLEKENKNLQKELAEQKREYELKLAQLRRVHNG